MLYLATDHRGFQLKEALQVYLKERGVEYEDVGDTELRLDDDYVDFASRAATKIAQDPDTHKGILICGSGHGVDIVANKFKGVRAALGFNTEVAEQSRVHDNANVLVLAADWIDINQAKKIIDAWLGADFSNEERHARRLKKIHDIEEGNFK